MKLISILFLFVLTQTQGQTENKIRLTENAFLTWKIKKFNPAEHSYEYCLNVDTKYLCKIDGKEWFGSDWGKGFPMNQLTELILVLDNKMIKLDTSQMFNPNFSNELYDFQFKLKSFGRYCKLYGFFSDGAGSYNVHWRIENGKSIREIISNDEKYAEWQLEN